MAKRRVTRYVSDGGLMELRERWHNVSVQPTKDDCFCNPITIEYDDGEEEPQVKTGERRVEGWGRIEDRGRTFFMSDSEMGDGNNAGLERATLIIHEPIPEPTLVEAVEAHINKWGRPGSSSQPKALETDGDTYTSMYEALKREKSKSNAR